MAQTVTEQATARTFTSTPESQAQRLLSERAALLRTIAVKTTREAARVEAIEAELRQVLPYGNTTVNTPAGEVSVNKAQNRRIDKDKATGMLRKGQFQRVSTRVLDTALLRKQYPDVAEQCWVSHPDRLTFR